MKLQTNTEKLTIIGVLGFFVILSYIIFIIYPHKFGLKKRRISSWWFGLDKKENFLRFFCISALCAVVGFLYMVYYICSYLDEKRIEDYDYINSKLITQMVVILSSTILWAPLVYVSFNIYWFKYLAAFILGVTTFSSITLLYYIIDLMGDNEHRNGAIASMCFFIFHTFFIDFIVWNYYYLT